MSRITINSFYKSLILSALLFLFTGVNAATYNLEISTRADRANPANISGQTVSGNVYIFLTSDSGQIVRVDFYLDDPSLAGAARKVEKNAPYDFSGGVATAANPFATDTLSEGTHTISARVLLADHSTHITSSTFIIAKAGFNTDLLVSIAPNRASPLPLSGQTLSGNAYIFADPDVDTSGVRFFLDDPTMSGPPKRTENSAPYDYAGGSSSAARPLDTTALADGPHTITAEVRFANRTETISASFIASNDTVLPPSDQIHLAWIDSPSTTLTVVWRTFRTDTPSLVRHRAVGATNWQSTVGALRPSGTVGTLHQVTLRGLTPGTAYEYQVQGDGNAFSEIYRTHTAPPSGPADFEAIYFADTGLIGRLDGLATGTEQVIREIANLKPLFVLAGGDYAYFSTDRRYGSLDNTIDAWFNQMLPVTTQAPMQPTYGNHEILLGEGYEPWAARFPTPEGFDSRRNYSFDIGDVHFVSILAAGPQGITSQALQWLEADITEARKAGVRWVVPFMHVSPFADGTNHPSNLGLRAQLGPLFERLGVKLVLSSHDQAYERTYPLVNVPATNTPTTTSKTCYTLSDGVTWVKTSPGGKLSNRNNGFSQFRTIPPPSWTAFRNNTLHNFVRLTVSASGDLRVDTFGLKGDGTAPIILDSFRYTQGRCRL